MPMACACLVSKRSHPSGIEDSRHVAKSTNHSGARAILRRHRELFKSGVKTFTPFIKLSEDAMESLRRCRSTTSAGSTQQAARKQLTGRNQDDADQSALARPHLSPLAHPYSIALHIQAILTVASHGCDVVEDTSDECRM
nr:hypothetical protein CFP56_76826 [Quercus suber]